MNFPNAKSWICAVLLFGLAFISLAALPGYIWAADQLNQTIPPTPLLKAGHPVDWWVVFKFNGATFPGCDGAERACPFGGMAEDYRGGFGRQFVYASSENAALQKGSSCAGGTTHDPLGATFNQIYNGAFYFVVWNDQFYDDPEMDGCMESCSAPWGHSKGLLAWNDVGEGMVLQVTTPSWPAAGSKEFPRLTDGNTLGCVADDHVEMSQHFFALKLTPDDLFKVLRSLQNASVVTDPTNPQIVNNGGPPEAQRLVESLGRKSKNKDIMKDTLSSGVVLISKPSHLNVPPWQMVSAELGGASLRVATSWTKPYIPTTTADMKITCWDSSLRKPGAVEIATTGQWDGKTFGLKGGQGRNRNDAKIGVSTSDHDPYSIFGDMDQQGSLMAPKCARSQNGRGGMFYVVKDKKLFDSMTNLIKGDTAPGLNARK